MKNPRELTRPRAQYGVSIKDYFVDFVDWIFSIPRGLDGECLYFNGEPVINIFYINKKLY